MVDFAAKDMRQAGALPAPAIAVRMPCMIRAGLGGQPGTATSTGMMLETRPRVAPRSPKIPPVQPQSPSATTRFGSGVAA